MFLFICTLTLFLSFDVHLTLKVNSSRWALSLPLSLQKPVLQVKWQFVNWKKSTLSAVSAVLNHIQTPSSYVATNLFSLSFCWPLMTAVPHAICDFPRIEKLILLYCSSWSNDQMMQNLVLTFLVTSCFVWCETGNAEEHATLSRALTQLAEVEEKIEQLHIQQVDCSSWLK